MPDSRKLPETPNPVPSSAQVACGLMDDLLEGCQVIGFDWTYRYINDAAARHGRLSKAQLLGKSMIETYPGIDATPMFSLLRACMEDRVPGRMDNEFTFADGSTAWFDLRFQPVADGVLILSVDITTRKQKEEEIRRFNARLEQLTHVVQKLSQARSVEAIADIVRHTARALVGSDGATFVLRDGDKCYYLDEDAITPLWKGQRFPMSSCISGWVMLHRRPTVIEDISVDERIPQDAYRPTFVRSLAMVPIRGNDPIGAIGNYWARRHRATEEDIRILQALADSTSVAMENVQIYHQLENSERRYRDLVENLDDLVVSLDPQGRLQYVSPAARKFGYAPKEMCFRSFSQFVHGQDLDAVQQNMTRAMEGDAGPCEFRILDKKKEVRHVRASFGALREGERVSGLTGVLTDVTEQRRTEEQLQRSQRLEAVGRLAGGVAHDFNNLLTVIRSYADFALEEVGGADALSFDIQEIKAAASRATELTRQLLAFSRRQVLQLEVINLNTAVSGLEKMLRRLIGEDIDFETRLDAALGNVRADPVQIEQVVMNLVVNARDAMPSGGKLTLETANAELDEAYAHEHPDATPGPHVMLSVTDTGLGMSQETRARLFEPFFTTKEAGKGTGLGLSTVYGIVRQSGGNIWVYSEPGQGTAFKIYLPRVLDETTQDARPAPSVTLATGHETVLVVEDEPAVRTLVKRILGAAGYTVLTATDGVEALEIYAQGRAPVHLLLTDVVMPRMSGKETARRLQAMQPDLAVLYMSGYTDNAIVHHGVLAPGTDYIGKPFSAAELTRKVREVLDAALEDGKRA